MLKQRTTRKGIVPLGANVFLSQTSEEKDLMPGNNSFGFFYKEKNNREGYCRLRLQFFCDYGLEVLKEIKNQDVLLQIAGGSLIQKTGHDGIADIIFHCSKKWLNETALVRTGKFESAEILTASKGTYRIPDKQCKQ